MLTKMAKVSLAGLPMLLANVSLAGLPLLLANVSLAGLPLLASHLLPVYFAFSSCLLHILCEFLHQA
jgi:hypothetical protein